MSKPAYPKKSCVGQLDIEGVEVGRTGVADVLEAANSAVPGSRPAGHSPARVGQRGAIPQLLAGRVDRGAPGKPGLVAGQDRGLSEVPMGGGGRADGAGGSLGGVDLGA